MENVQMTGELHGISDRLTELSCTAEELLSKETMQYQRLVSLAGTIVSSKILTSPHHLCSYGQLTRFKNSETKIK